ncbi:MAG: NUDIX domain-containing protein [Persephonella sp.]|nr:NUDIX domain-containing protein [Persephonella sp.]
MREVKEETGVDAEIVEYLGEVDYCTVWNLDRNSQVCLLLPYEIHRWRNNSTKGRDR